MKKIIDYIVKNRLNFLLIILWFLIAIIGLTHHELWRDETQVWCVVRDLDLTSIFNAVRIEGHPLLWYLIFTPFAKLNFPVENSGFKKIFSTQPHTISRQTQREVYSIYLKENK